MTIASQQTYQQSAANGTTTQFSFPNKIFSAADLVVTLIDELGNFYAFNNSSTNTYSNGPTGLSYTVYNVDVDNGCYITFTGAPIMNWVIDMRTAIAELQSTSIKNQGGFLPELHEEFFDKATRMIQDLYRLTYTFGIHGTDIEQFAWPSVGTPAARANTNLGFDQNGVLALNIQLATNTLSAGTIGFFLYPILPSEIGVVFQQYPYGCPLRYGADGSGVGDSTQAIINAIASYDNVQFPPGKYTVSSQIPVTTPCWIQGSGYATVIAPNFASGDVFEVQSPGVDITDMQFSPTVLRTSGFYVNLNGSGLNYIRLERLLMSGAYRGIGVTGGGNGNQLRIANVLMTMVASGGECVLINTTNNEIDVYLENLFLLGPTIGPQNSAGVRIYNSGDVVMSNVSTVGTGSGLSVCPQAGQTAQYIIVGHGCQFDSGIGNGIDVDPGVGGVVNYIKTAPGTWCSTNGNGVSLGTSNTGQIQYAEIIDIQASNNGPGGRNSTGGTGQGIVVNSNVLRHVIRGGTFAHNANAIYEGVGVTNFEITGIIAGPVGQFATNTGYAIVLAGSNDYFNIHHNNLQANTLGAIDIVGSLAGTPGQTYFIEKNFGFITDAQGTQALATASTSTTVTHGLAYTPLITGISLRPQSSLGTAAQAWVSAVGSTTFTITTNANPGAGVNVGWTAQALH